ncbi:hypothetical protein [Novosphingobium sp.]|uniref:hypothetical protein n=1 Tax=Novosphingobium sp. TaxID=1874826 RepID=UPI003BA9F676
MVGFGDLVKCHRNPRVFIGRAFGASAVLLGLSLAAYPLVAVDKLYFGSAYLLAEAVTVAVVWFLVPQIEEVLHPHLAPHSLQKVRTEIRFVTTTDFAGMDRIFDATLDPEQAMDDADFLELMKRGTLVRVMQEDFGMGSERISRIAGYYSLWPLKEGEFDRIVQGTLKEENLKPCDIPDLNDSSVYVLYLSEVCSENDADHRSMLMRDMLRYIAQLLRDNPNIDKIATWPSSEDGKRWSDKLGLKPCRVQRKGRRIYALDRRAVLASPYIPSGQFKERVVVTY